MSGSRPEKELLCLEHTHAGQFSEAGLQLTSLLWLLPAFLPPHSFPSFHKCWSGITMRQVPQVLGLEGRGSLLHGILSSLSGMMSTKQVNRQVNAPLEISANALQEHT